MAGTFPDEEVASMRAYVVDVANCAGLRCVSAVAASASTREQWTIVLRDIETDLGCKLHRPHDGGWTPRLSLARWMLLAYLGHYDGSLGELLARREPHFIARGGA